MNYQQIVDTAVGYSDKQDAGVGSMLSSFLLVVEQRLGDALKVREMAKRAQLWMSDNDQQYVGLPYDFDGLRDIQLNSVSLDYVSPSKMNELLDNQAAIPSQYVYTIIADQLQIYPATNETLEIIYYARIPPLTTLEDTNWVSQTKPNLYIFGLLVEIFSYVQDGQAGQIWEQRFQQELAAVRTNDDVARWSGTPMRIVNG
jgi:hypothetical protein